VLHLHKASTEPRKYGVPAPDDAAELDKPTLLAETADEFGLVGQQLAFYRALAEQDERIAGWYLGARITLLNIKNPERLQQAAHSLRELIDKLNPVLGFPAQAEVGRLGDAFDAMRTKWEEAKRKSTCHTDGGWSGEIDGAARRGFVAVDEAIEWQRKNRPRRKETYRATIRALDVSGRALPAWIEDTYVQMWERLRDYFVRVCHHDYETSEDEFSMAVDTLEVFVLERLKPATYAEQATLDQLIAEAERDA
jgi:hypothetical protein